MNFTPTTLKALLVQHDDGILRSGSHKDGREFCAMEFLAKVAGEPWTDHPECVHKTLGAYCRKLNDSPWPSDEARTETMLPLLAAVFGTAGLNISIKNIAEQTIRLIVPIALEAAASKAKEPHATKLRECANRCKNEGTKEAAQQARTVANAAYAADAADAAADAAYAAADAAADAARRWRAARLLHHLSTAPIVSALAPAG